MSQRTYEINILRLSWIKWTRSSMHRMVWPGHCTNREQLNILTVHNIYTNHNRFSAYFDWLKCFEFSPLSKSNNIVHIFHRINSSIWIDLECCSLNAHGKINGRKQSFWRLYASSSSIENVKLVLSDQQPYLSQNTRFRWNSNEMSVMQLICMKNFQISHSFCQLFCIDDANA